MAIFYMQISSIARSTGRRATAAAAYRSAERIRDERTGKLYNHIRRRDVLHAEIFLPSQFDGVAIGWARDRERLWNTAERTEKGYNSRVAREYQVGLPVELDPAQQVALARAFSREIAERYKVAVDLAVHAPRPGGDPRNFHAHLLTTTREVTPAGLGARTGLDMPPVERHRHGLPDLRQEFVNMRERWATLTNEALREAHVAARIDHRSLAAQGIDREPRPAIPLMHLKMEQRGLRSELAERLRAEYRERVQMRQERALASAATKHVAPEPRGAQSPVSNSLPVVNPEEIRRQAVEAWLRLRSQEAQRTGDPSREPAQGKERTGQERDAREPEQHAQSDLAL